MKLALYFILWSATGAFLRLGLLECLSIFGQNIALTWGVFMVNVLGCGLFGAGWVYTQGKELHARLLLVAFLGSFTTFSAYIYDIYRFISQERYDLLLSNGLLQLVLGIIFLRLGIYMMQCVQK